VILTVTARADLATVRVTTAPPDRPTATVEVTVPAGALRTRNLYAIVARPALSQRTASDVPDLVTAQPAIEAGVPSLPSA
jgi:hypothetical protein